jgi:hypothetical protein
MNFNVVDEANYPLAGIAVVGVDPLLPDIINNVTFTYNRTPVSASNLLPVGDVANATADFSSGGQVGSSYTVTIMTTLTSGETMTYNESLSLGCTCTTGTSQGYYVNGTIDVPLGIGNGTLTVEIHDDGVNNDSITAVIFPSLGFENATSIPNSASLVLMLHGSPVSSQNPVLPGESAAGSISVVNMTAGTAYQINVVITFGNGSQEVEGLPIAAQL